MKFQIYMDANFFSNSHSFAYSNGIARTENTYVKAARKLFRAASNKDERDTMSLKRPRNIEVKTIDHRRIGPAELKTFLPDKASMTAEITRLKMKGKARDW